MPSPRAIIKKKKRKDNWHSARQEWPEEGQEVMVIATILAPAILMETKPHRIWNVQCEASHCEEVKFWKEIDDASTTQISVD